MVNVILGRIELFASLHVQSVQDEGAFHVSSLAHEEQRHVAVTAAEAVRRTAQLDLELDNLVYNTAQRCKARGIKKREDRHEWLHTLSFDQSFLDLNNAEQKDFRVREYFDPLLEACGGNKKLLLERYTLKLDRYFPINRTDLEWGAILRKIPFKSRRKSDTRTTTYTIIHNYRHIRTAE